jgi:hypothetical protein
MKQWTFKRGGHLSIRGQFISILQSWWIWNLIWQESGLIRGGLLCHWLQSILYYFILTTEYTLLLYSDYRVYFITLIRWDYCVTDYRVYFITLIRGGLLCHWLQSILYYFNKMGLLCHWLQSILYYFIKISNTF